MGHLADTVERRIARIAAKSHGVVTRGQLLQAGITAKEITGRLRSGLLLKQHRGVYRAGHAGPSPEATFMAAVRAAGPGALLCGRAAAWVLGLLRGKPPRPEVLTTHNRRIPGVRCHRTRRLHPADRGLWRGIPVTSAARTVVDLAAELAEDDLARVFHEANVRHHTSPDHVEEILTRRPRTSGAATARSVAVGEVRVALSKLESKFLTALRDAGHDPPITNQPAGAHRVDCHWPELGLIVELDSYRYHRSRHAWEQDRHREREARGRGEELHRFTHDDVYVRTADTVDEVGRLIATRSTGLAGPARPR